MEERSNPKGTLDRLVRQTECPFPAFQLQVDQNRAAIQGYNSILEYFPAYSMHRQLDATNVPSKWKMFVDGNHTIRTKQLTPEDSVEITKRLPTIKR